MDLRKYSVTVVRFNAALGIDNDPAADQFTFPVDSPDEEHALSAAMCNAVTFTLQLKAGTLAPIAFCATGITLQEEQG